MNNPCLERTINRLHSLCLCLKIQHRPAWQKHSLPEKLHRNHICSSCQEGTYFLSQLFAKRKTVLNGVSQAAISLCRPYPKNLLQNNIPLRSPSFCLYEKSYDFFSEQKPVKPLFCLFFLNSAWSILSQKPVKIKLQILLIKHAYTYVRI